MENVLTKRLIFLVVIASLTRGASNISNILKVVILSTTRATDCERDAHCKDVTSSMVCDNPLINYQVATWPSLLVAAHIN